MEPQIRSMPEPKDWLLQVLEDEAEQDRRMAEQRRKARKARK